MVDRRESGEDFSVDHDAATMRRGSASSQGDGRSAASSTDKLEASPTSKSGRRRASKGCTRASSLPLVPLPGGAKIRRRLRCREIKSKLTHTDLPIATTALSTGSNASPPSQTSFLSRFVSTFRPPAPSTSVNSRPSLPRSYSSPSAAPLLATPSTSSLLPPQVPLLQSTAPDLEDYVHSSNQASRSTSSFTKRFRPGNSRRATDGSLTGSSSTRSPPGSPSLSSTDGTSSNPESPPLKSTSSKEMERDPMDAAGTAHQSSTKAMAGSSSGSTTGSSVPASVPMGKKGSVTSQMTVLPSELPRSPALSHPSPLSHSSAPASPPVPQTTTPSTTTPTTLEDPLAILTSLLPPALLLLSYLGPSHLFSPPITLPTLETLFSPYSQASASGSSNHGLSSDRASIASSRTSDSVPSIQTSTPRAPGHTHELYAPSTISVPAVSAAAVWRIFRGFEWLGELGKEESAMDIGGPDVSEEAAEKVFDFPGLLQGAADVLAADAASRGVELVIGQVGSGTLPSPVQTPRRDPFTIDPKGKDTESRELLVRADERAWGVALVWILSNIIKSASPGATIEVHFVAIAASRPAYLSLESVGDSQSTLPTRRSLDTWWTVTLEILHTFASTPSPESAPAPETSLFASSLAQALLAFFHIRIEAGPSGPGTQAWILETTLPGARPVVTDPDDPSTLLGRRRASLEAAGQEPTIDDLKRFAELGLKGARVALHSGEQSTFAKHLTTYLAGWGMDVSHVALDRDDSDSTTRVSNETTWNRGKREHFSRYDSGLSGSSGTESHSPVSPFSNDLHLPPHKAHSSDSSSRSSTIDLACPLIIIDDDVLTLRRLLYSFRPSLNQTPAPSLIAKRPQLGTRRSLSSPHVRQLHQLPPPPPPGTVIIHFASLTQYKVIKELVQDVLASSRTPSMPDVLVIPKPAGPRRIITALWTALKRPPIDPSLPPIATSPTSPGVQYWTPRLSPALMNQQDFDSAAAEALGAKDLTTGAPKVRTPPLYFPAQPTGMPPSPLGKITDDQVSYFSCVAETMEGTTPSEGVVIQSPDGRPGIFFQPQGRKGKGKAGPRAMEREAPSEEAEDGRPNVSAPHEIGLGHPSRRVSSATSSTSGDVSPVPIGTPAIALESLIAKSRGHSADNSPESPAEAVPETPLSRAVSSTSVPSRPPSTRPTSGTASPRVVSAPRRLNSGSSPPLSPDIGGGTSPAPTPLPRITTAAATAPPPSRRASGMLNSPHGRRKPRRTTLPTVPPICVLIVEDNPINQTILSMFMKKKGIKYDVAKDGEEAVQKWKRGGFHLVLMDIQLPVKDGIEATQEIRDMERANNIGTLITTPTSDPSSPISPTPTSATTNSSSSGFNTPGSPLLNMPVIIVALTASSLQADRVNALAAGCNDFLTKPVSLPWLQQKLLEWGSMAYLSGFSRVVSDPVKSRSGSLSISAGRGSKGRADNLNPGFSQSLNSSKAADAISQHLHIDPRPPNRNTSPSRPDNSNAPVLTISSPTPVLTPQPVPAGPIVAQTVKSASQPADLDAVDDRLEGLASLRRPGPSPLSAVPEPSLESVVAEGALWAEASRSRANSTTADSFSHVMNASHGAAGSPLVGADESNPQSRVPSFNDVSSSS